MTKKNGILVFERFSSSEEKPVGKIISQHQGSKESLFFEYDRSYLESCSYRFTLDPSLSLFEYEQVKLNQLYTAIFLDSLPDVWGRKLMRKKELIDCYVQKRKPQFHETQLLLKIHNDHRIGGLTFRSENRHNNKKDISFIPDSRHLSILRRLALNFEIDEPFRNQKDFSLLYSCAASLGGSTPKIDIKMPDNSLWIAKFNSHYDEYDLRAWEIVSIELARSCKIETAESTIVTTDDGDTVLLTKRFDRNGSNSVHVVSAKALLKTEDGSKTADYLDLAAFIKKHGSNPKQDLEQLFRRIVFTILIGNSNDHLKKYFFILKKDGWKLAPLIDPVPDTEDGFLSMCITDGNNLKSLELALSVHQYFSLSFDNAKEIIRTMKQEIRSSYHDLAELYGVSSSEIKVMKNALRMSFF